MKNDSIIAKFFGKKQEEPKPKDSNATKLAAVLTNADGDVIAKFMANGDMHIKGDVIAYSKAFENE